MLGTLVAIAALALALAAPSRAHRGEPDRPRSQLALLGDDVTRTKDGLFRVAILGGPSLLTHGPDPRATMDDFDLESAAPNQLAERPPVCASDYYQHVLYGRPVGAPDLLAGHRPTIISTMRRSNALLNADSVASGNLSADYKVLCDEAGQIRIDSFTSLGISFGEIVEAARAAGYANPSADYTIFFDVPSTACGIGSYRPDADLSVDNENNEGGGYGVVYQGCWDGDTAMHENAHAQGAVQPDAPHSTGSGGHCFDERDVLCYSPDGGDRNQGGTTSVCPVRLTFDCGYDDYFDSAPEPDDYLADHWNLGSSLNRFIAFSGAGPVPPEPQRDPPCRRARCAPKLSTDGQPRSGIVPRAGKWTIYRFRVKRGTRAAIVSLAPDECGSAARCKLKLDLFVRRGKPPTARRWDCRAAKRKAREVCRIRKPRRGKWYAGIRSRRDQPGASFSIRVRARGR